MAESGQVIELHESEASTAGGLRSSPDDPLATSLARIEALTLRLRTELRGHETARPDLRLVKGTGCAL